MFKRKTKLNEFLFKLLPINTKCCFLTTYYYVQSDAQLLLLRQPESPGRSESPVTSPVALAPSTLRDDDREDEEDEEDEEDIVIDDIGETSLTLADS